MKLKNLLYLVCLCFLGGTTTSFAQVLLSESFDATTFPPTGWTSLINSGTYDWQRVVGQSTAPTIYPSALTHSGAGMACFKSFSASSGSAAELRTPVINLVYPSGMNVVKFWMYRDPGYASNADLVQVYANTTASATGATLLGTVNRSLSLSPLESATGWFEYQFTIPATFNTATNYIIFKGVSAYGNDMFIDDISVLHITPCSGAPAAGTTVANPATVCGGNTSALSLNGAAVNSGMTYQWQDSVAPGTWQNITGATNTTYTTPGLTAPRYYRNRIICTGTNDTSYSVPVRVNIFATTLPYLETFESITGNNQLPNCMRSTNIGVAEYTYTTATGSNNQTNHTPGGSKYGSFYWLYTPNAFFTPAFNLIAGKTYEFSFWYITDGITGWNSLEAYWGTAPNTGAMTNLIGSVTPTPIVNTTYKRFVGTFTPTATGVYYVGIVCNHTTNPNYLSIDDIGLNELPACSGQPVGGAAVAVPTVPCPGTASEVTLNASATYASGITYQWEQSTGPTGPFTPVVGGLGGTTRYYTSAPVSAPIYYRAKMVCTLGTPDSAYSTPVLVTPVVTPLPYTETFESITTNNQYPGCMSSTNLGTNTRTLTSTYTTNQTNHTPGGSKYGMFYYYPAGTNAFFTPGVTLQAGKSYLFTFWYVNYSTTTTGITTLEAYFGNSPTVAGMTTLIGSAAPPNTLTYQQFQMPFTPTATGLYYVGIVANSQSSGSNYYTSIDDIGLVELVPCAGKPDPGVINPVTPCPNQAFTLTVNGGSLPTVTGNLTFQWEDSSALTGGTWQSSLGISTNPTLNVSGVNIPTKYRRRVTCTNSNQVDATPAYLVVPAPFINCYCIPTYATGASANTITNVKLRNLNNTSTGSSPWYMNYAPQQPGTIVIPDLTMDATDTLSISHSTNATNYSGVWIDFNHSGTFDANEFFTQGTNAGASGVAKIAITPPVTSLPGLTRMRIRAADRAVVTGIMPCGATGSAYGEAEDYLVNILYPVCTGPTNAGRVEATDTAICVGYTINLYDTTHEYRRSQISWSWQKSTDGGFTYTNMAGTQNKDTLLNVLVSGAVHYRVRMMCDATGDSSFSVPVGIRIKAPYECYCYSQSGGGTADSADIGSVTINSMVNTTGGPHVSNPTAIRRRTDYTGIRSIEMARNRKYRLSVYHIQRNGVHADALVTVFIDFNNDLQYNAFASPNSERVFQMVSTAGNYYIDTAILIPNAAVPNVPTGLRVILNNDLNPNSPANLGCGEYVSGETEDYVITFREFPSGVGSVGNLDHVTLYPNPTSGKFMVTAGAQRSMEDVEVLVTTVTGNVVLRKSYGHVGTKLSEELDLSEVARGVYFVEVKAGNGEKMVQKLVVR